MREKKREIEGEIAWERKKSDKQEISSDTPLRETEEVISRQYCPVLTYTVDESNFDSEIFLEPGLTSRDGTCSVDALNRASEIVLEP